MARKHYHTYCCISIELYVLYLCHKEIEGVKKYMKYIKLNNVIFPIWFLLFFPPVIFITLIGNFVIDSIVLIACFFIFKLADIQKSLNEFYKESILKV